MKKLLVLVVMLGLVVAANALTLTDNLNPRFDFNYGGTFLSLSIPVGSAFATAGNGSYALIYTGTGSISNLGAIGFNSGIDMTLDEDGIPINPLGDFNFGVESGSTLQQIGSPVGSLGNGIIINMTTFGPNAPTGVDLVWNIGVTPSAGATISFIKLLNNQTGFSGSELYRGTFVPEPVTVALLGLGGLFIRRNKK